MTPELVEFAKLIAQHIRDSAIRSCDSRLDPAAGGPIARRWRSAGENGSAAFARTLIPDVVDDTVFYLLRAIDDGILKISFSASNGNVVDIGAEGLGELSGWYMGRGWRDEYSNERYFDVMSEP
jgi:hypothetical protein